MKAAIANAVLASLLALASHAAWAQGAASGPVGLTVKPILQTTTTVTGQPIQFPQGEGELTAVIAEVAPGGQVGRHMHPVPLFVYILDGTLTIDMEKHGTHVFKAGQGFAEIVHSWHNGRNLEDKPVRFLIVFAGRKGTPNLIRP
jgi:quercetin dioxygenase-like cupin family protein